ncbi:hypothetical protein BDW71DRAFT_187332 [Aspergillus fruticulosus]
MSVMSFVHTPSRSWSVATAFHNPHPMRKSGKSMARTERSGCFTDMVQPCHHEPKYALQHELYQLTRRFSTASKVQLPRHSLILFLISVGRITGTPQQGFH